MPSSEQPAFSVETGADRPHVGSVALLGVKFDEPLLRFLRERQTARRTRAMLFVTKLGSFEVLTAVSIASVLALLATGNPRAARYVAVTASGASLMNQGAKALFARARPERTDWLCPTVGHAFPSGHAMSSTAIYGALALVVARRAPAFKWIAISTAGALSAAIGVSRSYLHVHYPSDVLAGWGLGVTWPLWLRKMAP